MRAVQPDCVWVSHTGDEPGRPLVISAVANPNSGQGREPESA